MRLALAVFYAALAVSFFYQAVSMFQLGNRIAGRLNVVSCILNAACSAIWFVMWLAWGSEL